MQAVHYPVMDLQMTQNILFYEPEAPSIQKIAVIDNTLYNPSFSTSSRDPPITRSMYAEVTVPFDSVDDTTVSFLFFKFIIL
jgi:hypothetical protein